MACNNTQQSEKAAISHKHNSEVTKRAEVEEPHWPNSGKSFKVDSSKFEVQAYKSGWHINLEKKASFQSQMTKMNKAVKMISSEADLSKLKYISIQWYNAELFADIALVPEIQDELKRAKNGNGVVNSLGVVSKHAYKSAYLNQFTSIFRQFNFEPYNYWITKCSAVKAKKDTANYTISCSRIEFELRKMKKK